MNNVQKTELQVEFTNGSKVTFPVGSWEKFEFNERFLKVINGVDNLLVAPRENVNFTLILRK